MSHSIKLTATEKPSYLAVQPRQSQQHANSHTIQERAGMSIETRIPIASLVYRIYAKGISINFILFEQVYLMLIDFSYQQMYRHFIFYN